jgi:catechol 2,3-dioxygenase-like lactoylglutathione lyase family enzyme
MKFLQLNHIALHVTDVEKSVRFYHEVLELELLPRPAFNFDGAWLRLGTDQELHLIAGRSEKVSSHSRGNHFALAVSSIQTVEELLKAKNVDYQPPKQRPDGIWQIFLQDHDGYIIEIAEIKAIVPF